MNRGMRSDGSKLINGLVNFDDIILDCEQLVLVDQRDVKCLDPFARMDVLCLLHHP